jgi:hypothetical protein
MSTKQWADIDSDDSDDEHHYEKMVSLLLFFVIFNCSYKDMSTHSPFLLNCMGVKNIHRHPITFTTLNPMLKMMNPRTMHLFHPSPLFPPLTKKMTKIKRMRRKRKHYAKQEKKNEKERQILMTKRRNKMIFQSMI